MNSFDVLVIGAGPAGYPAAIRAAQLGKRVAVVEREALGGTCLNWGCIPTKALLAAADLFHRAATSADLGIAAPGIACDYARLCGRKNEVVGRLTRGVRSLLDANGVTVLAGTARFLDAGRVSVRSAGVPARQVSASRIIVATGSVSAMPGFLPKHPRVVESRGFLDLPALPRDLIVLGGGIIGCEFACLCAHLGTRVTIVELLEDIVPMLDRDVRRVLRRRLEALGVTVLAGAPMTDIRADDRQVSGRVGDRTIGAELLLAAVGRQADTSGLQAERAGLAVDDKGRIAVDENCRTNVATIFAAGDVVAGSTQLAHAGTAQGIAAAENACGRRTRCETLVPACVFTTPEIAAVGLTAEQAQAAGRSVKTGLFPFSALGKAMAAAETEGFVRWVADAETDCLLGAQVVGAHATELIAEATLAIRAEITASELARTIHCHPTFSEAWMEAAHALHGTCTHLPPKAAARR
jgi:dihydrolipoamide dehydrogenase